MKAKILRAFGFATLLVLAVTYGMAAYKFELPPYTFIKLIADFAGAATPKEFVTTPQEYLATDVAGLISIKRQDDVIRLRRELIRFLWGTPGLSSALPSTLEHDIKDRRYDDISSSFTRIDKLGIVMEHGLESNVYHFISKTPNNQVVLYHEGHNNDFYASKAQIKKFLDAGYSVAAFAMPLAGLNNQPTVQIPMQGLLKMTTHDHMKFLVPENGHPIKYFVEPVVIVLNYLAANFGYASVSMVGISAGGWVTTLAAAVDPRIVKSFPVAGSYPIYLRSNSQRDWDDYEQTVPELFRTANYLELYILGSNGVGRKQTQIINQYDPCCFAGTKSETYKDIVKTRVHDVGPGAFDLFLDASHRKHVISDVAMSRIIDELGNGE